MPEEVVKFCEFWDELKNIYKETYPDAYKKYDFPDGETFLAIDYLTAAEKTSIKRAVEAGCVAPDTYENIKNILRSGKLNDKISSEDKQQILEDKWEDSFEDIRREWYFCSYEEKNHNSILAEAKKFIEEVNKAKTEQIRAEEAARRLVEQQKAAEKAEQKRQAEFEKIFREEDEEAEAGAKERSEEQKQLKHLQKGAEQNKKKLHRYLDYASKVAQKKEEREQKKAKRLEEEQSWTEEYRDEVNRRREIYRQNREKERLQEKQKLERELEQQNREREEAREKEKKKAERRIAESEALKNDLKKWLSDSSTSLAEKKEVMQQAKEQYQQNPDGILEWAKTLAKLDAAMDGLQNHAQFDFKLQKAIDQLKDACLDMQTQEATDEFLALIDQGKERKKEIDSARYQVYQETKNLPEYI